MEFIITEKLTALLLILFEQWNQTLLAIDIDNLKTYGNKLIILPNFSLKHIKLSQPIAYHRFNGNHKSCIAECTKAYIEIRKELASPEIK